MPLTNDPDSDPDLDAYPDPALSSLTQQKTNWKKKFFCILLFEGTLTTFTSFFKD
jgi:hypothetical protein